MQCIGIMRCVFAWNKSSTHHNKQDMARAIEKRNFEMYHRVKFQSIIRGHHVYKSIWSPYAGEAIMTYPDDQPESLEYDKFAVGIYKIKEKEKDMEEQKELAGHVPVELSSLIYHFWNASSENRITVEVTGKRKREVGLVVRAKFNALTKDKKTARVLDKELFKMKTRYKSCLELMHQQKNVYLMFPIYNVL